MLYLWLLTIINMLNYWYSQLYCRLVTWLILCLFESHFGQSKTTTKHNSYCSFSLVIPCFIDLPSVNQRSFSFCGSKFIFKVSPCSPSTRQVKLYLIKMLCSLPNSSPHIWFSLFVFCGWATTSIQLNQSLLKRETIWVTFLHVVWYDKAAAGPARNVSRQRATQKLTVFACYSHMHISFPSQRKEGFGFSESQQTVCEPNCHFPLPLEVAPVHLKHFYILKSCAFSLCITRALKCVGQLNFIMKYHWAVLFWDNWINKLES